jgi:hypothetical protein
LAQTLAPNGAVDARRLRLLLETAFPQWETSDEVPLIQVEGPTDGFPFEMLPLFGDGLPGREDVQRTARRFLAFSAAVWRVPPVPGRRGGATSGQRLVTKGPLPLSLFWFQPMRGARDEHDYFAGRETLVELAGPWPKPKMDEDEVLDRLGAVLFDPSLRFPPDETGRELLIQHFACHCDTAGDEPAYYELELAGGPDESCSIRLGELGAGFDARQRDLTYRQRPLVFLNACGSAHADPWRVYSWPQWFLANGHRGVIGTETLVPDRAAARFSRFFYDELLGGTPLGAALVRARRRLLAECLNPLGILYVLYADPDITIHYQQKELSHAIGRT